MKFGFLLILVNLICGNNISKADLRIEFSNKEFLDIFSGSKKNHSKEKIDQTKKDSKLDQKKNSKDTVEHTKKDLQSDGAKKDKDTADQVKKDSILDKEKDHKEEKETEESSKSKEEEEKKDNDDKVNSLKLRIGGLFDAEFGFFKQQDVYNQALLPNNLQNSSTIIPLQNKADNVFAFGSRSRIDFNPEFYNKDINIKVGVMIATPLTFMMNNINNQTDPKTATQEYLYLEAFFGRFEIGSTYSAASKMRVDPSKISSGSGGVYGDWWRYVQFPVFNVAGLSTNDGNILNSMSPIFMIYPTLPNEAGFTVQRFLTGGAVGQANFLNQSMTIGNLAYSNNLQAYPTQGARSNKISFYSKRLYGVQLGVSYSPTTANTGFMMQDFNNAIYSTMNGGFVTNLVDLGINFKKQFEDIGVALSITQEYGTMQPATLMVNNSGTNSLLNLGQSQYFQRNDLNATAYGIQLTYKHFAISYAYNNWGRSLLLTNASYQQTRSDSHVLGVGLNYGPLSGSIQYMRSNFSGNMLNVISVGSDVKLMTMKYLMVQVYAEYTHFWLSSSQVQLSTTTSNATYNSIANKGDVFLTGIRMIF